MLILHTLFPRGGVTNPPIGEQPPPTPIPSSVGLSVASFTITTGNLYRLVATVYDQSGDPVTGQTITWSSDDTAVATVDSSGTVTGVSAGSCTITASSGSLTPATAGATVEAAPVNAGWSDTRYPHASHGVLISYTDFRTSYLSAEMAETERQFIARKADKVVSAGEPAAGYPVGLIHQPYILTSWIAACVHDSDNWNNGRSKTDKIFTDWCAANSKDPEDGYIHYASGADTYNAEIIGIDLTGRVTLKYDLVTYTDGAFRDGDTVTISGVTPTTFNGTWTISGVGVTGGDFDANGDLRRAQTVFTIAHTGETATAFGRVKRVGDGTKTRRNRFVFLVGDNDPNPFPPPRWVINHAHPTRIAFERERLATIATGGYGVGFAPEGLYVDEISQNTWGKFMNLVSVEYPAGGGSQWLSDFAAFYATMQADFPNNPWMQEVGTGAYTKPETTTLIDSGSRCTQLEQLFNTHIQFEWMPANSKFEWVRSRLAAGAYLEAVTPYYPSDKIDGGEKPGNYATDPVPAGFRSIANVRMAASVFTVALLLQLQERPYTVAVNVWNGAWTPTDPLAGLNNRWLGLFEVDLGLPIELAARVVSGQTDTAGQAVTVAARHYERGFVLYRRVDANPSTADYAATYRYTLPLSTGAGGLWCRVRSDGSLDSPTATCDIASDEGLVFLPAPTTGVMGPTATLNPTSGVAINPGDNWQTVVNANPAGTTYWIKAGTHTGQSVTPKTGDVYWGEAGAIMDGENTVKKAFFSTADNVTIRNLVVKNYNCDVSDGAIRGDWTESTGWVMEHLEVTGCMGAGIYMSHSSRVSYCNIHHNGQIGLLGWAEDSVLEYSEVAFNNTGGNDPNGEAGGMKFFHAASMTVRNNYVHDNTGPGIWFDAYNYSCTIDGNRVEDNTHAGIFYEISYAGIIRNNTVSRNGGAAAFTRAGIYVSSSPDCEIYGNTLSDNASGIIGQVASRAQSTDPTLDRGPVVCTGLYVHDNTTNLTKGTSGLVDQIGDGAIFGAGANNRFVANTYTVNGIAKPFSGNGGAKTWVEWQAAGYDVAGTLT